MKKQDLLVFSFLPTAFRVVFGILLKFLPAGLGTWIVTQAALTVALLLIWWALGRWCGERERTPWNSFALLQWWGVVNLVFGFLKNIPVLERLAQGYAGCVEFFFLPLVAFSDSVFFLPMEVLLLLVLSSTMFLLGFRTVENRRNSL